jgi:formylglycine-generating enzyme required for sulfatase activity
MAGQVRLFEQTYTVPDLNAQLAPLNAAAQHKASLVRTGRVEEPGFLGIFKRQRELTVEERYDLVAEMVLHYDQIIGALTQGRDGYLAFLGEIEAGLGRTLDRKLEGYASFAKDLQQQEANARAKGRQESVRALSNQQEELRQYLKVTTQAGLLILKKIEHVRKSILSLVEDQGKQVKLLDNLKEELGDKRQIYLNQKRLQQMRQEAQAFAQVAIDFEYYLKDYFGPLQGLLQEVGRVDEGLAKAVGEIQALTAQLQEGRAALVGGQGEDRVLDLLVSADLKRDQVSRLVSNLGAMGSDLHEVEAELITGNKSGVLEAVETVQTFFHGALKPSLETQVSKPAPSQALNAKVRVWVVPNLGLEMVHMPAGSFMMGSPLNEQDRFAHEVQHEVKISSSFCLAKTPITVAQWRALVSSKHGHATQEDANKPMVNLSWFDAVWLCNKLSRRESLAPCYELVGMAGVPGNKLSFQEVRWLGLQRPGYRLPTEAEWEYACRAGTHGARYMEPLDQIAWYGGNSNGGLQPVAQKLPNAWGLYDMLGNVWEWCQDQYGGYHTERSPVIDPLNEPSYSASNSASRRVCRGGSWYDPPVGLRAADRGLNTPGVAGVGLGVRCARSIE